MKVSHFLDAEAIPELPGVVKREVITDKDGAPNFCMRVFELQPGSSTPSHSHQWEHELYVLSGEGVAVSEGKEIPIVKDTAIFVPPNEHHCFINKGKEILRMICVIPLLSCDQL